MILGIIYGLQSSRFWMALFLSSIFPFAQDVNFCVSFISQDRQRWKLSLIMCLKYLLHSHPGWSHYHQFLLHHWSEKYNFSTNRLFCLKRRFLYIIWPPIFKFDFRYYLWSSVASSSRFWMVLDFSSISSSAEIVTFRVFFISLGQRTWKLC